MDIFKKNFYKKLRHLIFRCIEALLKKFFTFIKGAPKHTWGCSGWYMKRFLILLSCIFSFSIFIPHTVYGGLNSHTYDPVLAIVIMVKNEQDNIVKTLEPYVQAGINSYLVFDTGSTDQTIEVISNYFVEQGVTDAHIRQEPFIDFATSRNRALDLAQEIFPNAGFFLMPDAEWYMEHADSLVKFCDNELESGNARELYLVRIGNEYIDFFHARLFKGDTKIRFVGSVHEIPSQGTGNKTPHEVFFHWMPSKLGAEKSFARWKRDKVLLEKDYAKDPLNARTLFYLAQTYSLLGEAEKAAEFYLKRTQVPGFVEETYVAWYRLGHMYATLCSQGKASWAFALLYYMQAFAYRPCRAEPLITLARHYVEEGNYDLAYLYARRACEIPYPAQDILFIDKNLYDYDRYEILSRACVYVKDYIVGEWATLKALAIHPDDQRLRNNLKLHELQKKGLSSQTMTAAA